MVALGARADELGGSLVDVLGEGDIMHFHLSRAHPASPRCTAGLGFGPTPSEQLDLILVLVVLALTFDAVYLAKHISEWRVAIQRPTAGIRSIHPIENEV